MRARVRISLGEPHLLSLLRGGVVTVMQQGVMVELTLRDIGFHVIRQTVETAAQGPGPEPVNYEDKQ
jgi:hypothetical protein